MAITACLGKYSSEDKTELVFTLTHISSFDFDRIYDEINWAECNNHCKLFEFFDVFVDATLFNDTMPVMALYENERQWEAWILEGDTVDYLVKNNGVVTRQTVKALEEVM